MDAAFWLNEVYVGELGGLPFQVRLADEGYDVWMANARGSWYSQDHTSLSAKDDNEYWLFNFGDVGYYDVPAIIETIREETGHEKVYFIGYS